MSRGILTQRTTWQAALAAFAVYSCMYAFRKPYAAATFEGLAWLGLSYKVWLVVAQTCGYALSKFYGIRFIAAMPPVGRKRLILALIAAAWIALLGFALVPRPFDIFFLFLNGMPLGLVFGVVFSYLEGRRSTEFLGAVLASTFVFSSGAVKSVGKWLLLEGRIPEHWMPFAAGALFVVPLLLSAEALERTPAPDAADQQARTKRQPMSAAERSAFLQRFGPGIVLMVAVYILLTLIRDVRDNFAAEIWSELGYGQQAAIFTTTEVPVAVLVLILMSQLIWVKNNRNALWLNHMFIIGGLLLAAGATLAFRAGSLGPLWWFAATGLGLYLSYIPFNGLLFDRLLATFGVAGNVGFVMYIADAFGYLGSVTVLSFKELAQVSWSWNAFFQNGLLLIAILGSALMAAAWAFFARQHAEAHASQALEGY
ncbi:MAG: DUF5690 family protein [Saprospiraceae bacterium]|nr:DUF5690 family protein [Saprospiraceae bacterium]MDW8229205.1 DUF5690 family protein [Saprospiraceae bacterium]